MADKYPPATHSGLILLLAVLAGCQSSSTRPASYIAYYQDYPPGVEQFQVCSDVECTQRTSVTLDQENWRRLGNSFSEKAGSPEAERHQIKSAIALFEDIAGPITNTQYDQPGNDIRLGQRQLDCIAETVNTTTYLMLFEQQGWLKRHRVGSPKHRGLFTLQAPHNAALIVEKASGREYVVDSWFHKNGEPPEIVPAEKWSAGYAPDDLADKSIHQLPPERIN